jgi:hypothetical protein
MSKLIVDLGGDGMVRIREELLGKPLTAGEPTSFAWPLDENAAEDLRWYLEDYLRAPFGVYEDRGTRIEEELQGWGELVFESVFAWGQARNAYVRARQHGNAELVLR